MSKKEQITKAVAAHAFWKVRLQGGIAARAVDVRSSEAKRDDACEFGKWLHDSASAKAFQADPHYRKAIELHAKFHQAVGACVSEIERGHVDAAKKLLEDSVAHASIDLTREMMAWNKVPE